MCNKPIHPKTPHSETSNEDPKSTCCETHDTRTPAQTAVIPISAGTPIAPLGLLVSHPRVPLRNEVRVHRPLGARCRASRGLHSVDLRLEVVEKVKRTGVLRRFEKRRRIWPVGRGLHSVVLRVEGVVEPLRVLRRLEARRRDWHAGRGLHSVALSSIAFEETLIDVLRGVDASRRCRVDDRLDVVGQVVPTRVSGGPPVS